MKAIFDRFFMLLVLSSFILSSCNKTVFVETEYESTNLPTNGATIIPFYGGTYNLKFRHNETVTKADSVFADCQYRVNYGSKIGKAVKVDHTITSVDVEITPNNSDIFRDVIVQVADDVKDAEWETVVTARQEPGMVKVGETWWAKGNVTVKDEKYIIAKTDAEPGLFFFGCNEYGIPADDKYDGDSYTPTRVRVGLDFIAKNKEIKDACTIMDPGLRTPTYAEFQELYDLEDIDKSISQNFEGMSYKNTNFVLPFHGFFNIKESYWYNNYLDFGYQGYGWDLSGNSLVYTANRKQSSLSFNVDNKNMSNLRCVKNTKLPVYLSHQLPDQIDYHPCEVSVVTDPGEISHYEVLWEATDGTLAVEKAGKGKTQVTFTIPMNKNTIADREWHLFVNHIPVDVHFNQPRMQDYIQLVSYTPEQSGFKAFKVNVKCKTDRLTFMVRLAAADGTVVEEKGTKSRPEVTLSVPFNETQEERVFSIYLDGEDTGRKITQAASPKAFDTVWSPGYLKVNGQNYEFAAPTEKGYHFKWNSYFGISYSAGSQYPGQVWCPTPVTMGFNEIPSGILDPCTMVKPNGTWRMPQVKEIQDLVGTPDPVLAKDRSWTLDDKRHSVCLAAGGYSPSGVLSETTKVMFWSVDQDGSKYKAVVWNTKSGQKASFVSYLPSVAMQIRCVKDK